MSLKISRLVKPKQNTYHKGSFWGRFYKTDPCFFILKIPLKNRPQIHPLAKDSPPLASSRRLTKKCVDVTAMYHVIV